MRRFDLLKVLCFIFCFLFNQLAHAEEIRNLTDTIPATDVTFYVSNNGSNTSDGTSESTPKKNIGLISSILQANAQAGAKAVISLEQNSIFREEFIPVPMHYV